MNRNLVIKIKVAHLGAGYAVAGGVQQPHEGRVLGVIALEMQVEGVTCHITNASHVTQTCSRKVKPMKAAWGLVRDAM